MEVAMGSATRSFSNPSLPLVCVQGLGFVGSAMAVAVASARSGEHAAYNVMGVDLPNEAGTAKVASINQGSLPFAVSDDYFSQKFDEAIAFGNLAATTDTAVYASADIVVIDIHCDVVFDDGKGTDFNLKGLEQSVTLLAATMKPGSLIVVETTVPPGTCEKVLYPIVQAGLQKRGLADDAILFAHSYERVTPGKNYLKSITDFYRVFSGINSKSADACEAFLGSIINTTRYPLVRLHNTTASETAKVMENSYRAVNIAFMEEWGRFAEAVGIDLFSVIDAIKLRPTHANMMRPGFAVGGYCLTKDPLFAPLASRKLFKQDNLQFPFSQMAVATNQRMPLVTLDYVEQHLGSLHGRKLLLLGASYLVDSSDTRHSGSEVFYREAAARGAVLQVHDALVDYWPELDLRPLQQLPLFAAYDALVFVVPHSDYTNMDIERLLAGAKPLVFDANRVLTNQQIARFRAAGCTVKSIGRGTTA